MASFKTRIRQAARDRGKIILACDYARSGNMQSRAIRDIERLHPYLCAIKINFHLLLALGSREISVINRCARRCGLQAIADIKLNDIGNTNRVAADALWKMGFDAVIANPIMGKDSLARLVRGAHREKKGVIALCHMSAPEAAASYELKTGRSKLYKLFLEWALTCRADGVVAGATFPRIVSYCRDGAKGRLDVYSPGIGTQGGSAAGTVAAGASYLIIGRTIIGARDPVSTARTLSSGL